MRFLIVVYISLLKNSEQEDVAVLLPVPSAEYD